MRRSIPMLAMALALLFSQTFSMKASAAVPAEQRVDVVVDVVLVSTRDTHVDPNLDTMRETFAKEHLPFTSFKRLSTESLTLRLKKPTELKLPTGQVAVFKLDSVQHGAAKVGVQIETTVNTTYTVGREGKAFVNAGHLSEGELFLVMTSAPASGGK